MWNHPGDLSYWHRHITKGSWAHSTADNGWGVSDNTGEALKATLLLSMMKSSIVGDPIQRDRLHDAVDFLLSIMNKDGSFSTYECERTYSWLEVSFVYYDATLQQSILLSNHYAFLFLLWRTTDRCLL